MLAVRFPLAVLAVTVAATLAVAQDKSPEVKKQKETAAELLKQVNVTKPAAVETANLLVYSTLSEEKTKPVADAAQKAFAEARKALKAGDKDKLWPGKLTVFAMPERKEFTTLMRLLENRKPENDETRAIRVRGDEPFVAVGVVDKVKDTDAALRGEATTAVAMAVLDHKGGVGEQIDGYDPFALPAWLRTGFSKAVAVRLDAKALDAHKAKVKGLVARTRPGAVQAADVWGDAAKLAKDADTFGTSLAEYMAYGPDADRFAKFLAGFKPTEKQRYPNAVTALEDAKWAPERLDADWKAWVTKQK